VFLAPERGSFNNTSLYKKTTPTSFRSPFTVQGDLGFITTNKKKYGIFFVAVQTFSKRIFCIPIKNNKSSTLVAAIQDMLKVNNCSYFLSPPPPHSPFSFLNEPSPWIFQDKYFSRTKCLLFDGEPALTSLKTQKEIFQKYQLKVYANASFKRNMAERAVKEVKIRLSIKLDLEGTHFPPPPPPTPLTLFLFFILMIHFMQENLCQHGNPICQQ
jgi:hypothetical protein